MVLVINYPVTIIIQSTKLVDRCYLVYWLKNDQRIVKLLKSPQYLLLDTSEIITYRIDLSGYEQKWGVPVTIVTKQTLPILVVQTTNSLCLFTYSIAWAFRKSRAGKTFFYFFFFIFFCFCLMF